MGRTPAPRRGPLRPPQAAATTTLSMEQAAAHKRQIFSPAEAFKMLSNELLAIIKKQDPSLFADSVADDV
jgi:hypothetical protein